jgi:hypothetical protein
VATKGLRWPGPPAVSGYAGQPCVRINEGKECQEIVCYRGKAIYLKLLLLLYFGMNIRLVVIIMYN